MLNIKIGSTTIDMTTHFEQLIASIRNLNENL